MTIFRHTAYRNIFPPEDGHTTETRSGYYWIKYSKQCSVRRKPWTWPSPRNRMQTTNLKKKKKTFFFFFSASWWITLKNYESAKMKLSILRHHNFPPACNTWRDTYQHNNWLGCMIGVWFLAGQEILPVICTLVLGFTQSPVQWELKILSSVKIQVNHTANNTMPMLISYFTSILTMFSWSCS
jgi:hypothetical protein